MISFLTDKFTFLKTEKIMIKLSQPDFVNYDKPTQTDTADVRYKKKPSSIRKTYMLLICPPTSPLGHCTVFLYCIIVPGVPGLPALGLALAVGVRGLVHLDVVVDLKSV